MKFDIPLVLCALIACVVCYDNTTMGDLPPDVAAQLLSLMANKTIQATGGCDKLQESDIELELYTRNNTKKLPAIINLDNIKDIIDPQKNVIILIHGWLANKFRFVPEMTDAYLDRYDANVITLDWSKLSKKFYTTSVCYVPEIAKIVADFLCLLEEKLNMPVNKVHLVGHSLGGQMSGFIGQYVGDKCGKKIGRITAMDPAGPLYQGLPTNQRLDESDAIFVDVIHTNEGVLGYWGNCGHAGFHVNCGTLQLGCQEIALSLEALKNILVSAVTCHHSRSVDYMTESISNVDNFQSKSCNSCPLLCVPNLLTSSKENIKMGEDCPNTARGEYALTTNLKSPYGKKLKIPVLSSLTPVL